MTTPSKAKIASIIHGAAVAAGAIGAGMSQAPGSDTVPIMGIQTAMITSIGMEYGSVITHQTAMTIIGTCSASYGGRAVSQWLLGWVPAWGNALNAATATAITEAVGWAASTYFEKTTGIKAV